MPTPILFPSPNLNGSGGVVGYYEDSCGRRRELCALAAAEGSTLVVDRDAATSGDQRLLAHLFSDEPRENVMLVCRRYLEHPTPPRCRALQPEDLRTAPSTARETEDAGYERQAQVLGGDGTVYRLRPVSGGRETAQLRWCRRAAEGGGWERVSLREVAAATESYEACGLSESALKRRREGVLTTRLRWELERLSHSPIVLNRGLRKAVLHAMRRHGTSMSDIARRCGAVKRNRHGLLSGETSWVARRIGVMPDGGSEHPTPWVHIDVLASIARDGLGISPREVELGWGGRSSAVSD
jgi:hypothetical protein